MGVKGSRQITSPFATVERTKGRPQKGVQAGQERAGLRRECELVKKGLLGKPQHMHPSFQGVHSSSPA